MVKKHRHRRRAADHSFLGRFSSLQKAIAAMLAIFVLGGGAYRAYDAKLDKEKFWQYWRGMADRVLILEKAK
jgi:hypothetical protein